MFMDRTLFPHQVTLMDLFIVAFCAKALIDLWNDSSLFASWRAYFEAWGGRMGELSECSFCQSYHVCFWVSVLGRLLAAVLPSWIGLLVLLIVFSLAATGVVHLLLDLNELMLDKMRDVGGDGPADDSPPKMESSTPPPDSEPIEEPTTIKMNGYPHVNGTT